ncbi:hypothetical protein H5410_037074 [Solanum commersonii]|uniref:Uncharacterized protein n=1 Tax=Solanum commersonii TaxID=4109 RepID=A0A9J5Y703_SOLCO|nr:hypothetical protein H5410_037074 [Solanum commersonii]
MCFDPRIHCEFLQPSTIGNIEHQWSSDRIVPYHGTDPGSIPYQQGLWWNGKYSFILNQEVLGSSPFGYGVAFVRERFTPQCGTSRRESGFSRAPMWVPDTGWETKKKSNIGSRANLSLDVNGKRNMVCRYFSNINGGIEGNDVEFGKENGDLGRGSYKPKEFGSSGHGIEGSFGQQSII